MGVLLLYSVFRLIWLELRYHLMFIEIMCTYTLKLINIQIYRMIQNYKFVFYVSAVYFPRKFISLPSLTRSICCFRTFPSTYL